AVALALSVSAFAGERFVFEGFLPAKGSARRSRLAELSAESRPLVFYEAPHRLAAFLADASDALGPDRRATVVREATKLHEEVAEDTLAALSARFADDVRGEITVVVEGAAARPDDEDAVQTSRDALLRWAMEQGRSPEGAARAVASLTGRPRNPLTRRARELAEDGPESPPRPRRPPRPSR
ncbi:MAG TPA: SAM-dependent methyltransferase, partial [bacterium]|nr:SAM-dependent methyltransferase [bacterium]